MKIALVANTFPSVSETFIYNHAAGLAHAGLDVTVVAARPSGDGPLFADFDGLRYDGPVRYPLLAGSLKETSKRVASRLGALTGRERTVWHEARSRYGLGRRAVRATLLALPLTDFDLVHFELSGLAVAWLDALPLLAPAKLVVSCRGAAEQITPLVDARRVDELRSVFAAVDRVHCVSDDMLGTCIQYGLARERAFVNRPAIDLSRFRRSRPYDARTTGPYRLLSTGRLHWKKGVEFALIAMRALLDAGHDVHYEIIGGGADEEHLRFSTKDLGLTDHVQFAGRRSSTEVRQALERCDVYVLPSLSEGISNAALEAMAMEIPVVATTAGGMSEVITDGVDGLLVPPRAGDAIARRVAELLASPTRRLEVGRAGRARLEQAFSLERQVRVFVDAYRALRG